MNNHQHDTRSRSRRQYMVAIDGALALNAILVIVQMWLLTASLEAYLSGHKDSALPGAVFSGLLFAGTMGLYIFVRRLERQAKDKGF